MRGEEAIPQAEFGGWGWLAKRAGGDSLLYLIRVYHINFSAYILAYYTGFVKIKKNASSESTQRRQPPTDIFVNYTFLIDPTIIFVEHSTCTFIYDHCTFTIQSQV